MLKPSKYNEDEYIYKEGDEVTSVHFLYAGVAGFVYVSIDNVVYTTIMSGDFIGLVDIVATPKAIHSIKGAT